jgi:hypothetical protein
MTSNDAILLEQAYYQILAEQQRLIEEGKIWDFIKSMGSKLKNAWDILNVKLISNPKIYKGLAIAGPIIASLLAKNFQNTELNSEAVKSLLETLNGIDPNISKDDLTDMLAKWDHEHTATFGKHTEHSGQGFSSSDIDVGDNKDGSYSFTGAHVKTTEGDAPGIGQMSKTYYVQDVTQTLESITTKSDIQTAVTNFISTIMKSSNTDGSGGTVVVEYSGSVTASSPEEAMKIMSELVKTAIQKSGIDVQNLNFEQPKVAIAAAMESLYAINPNIYLTELQALDKLKSMAKGAANTITSGANAAKSVASKIIIGAKDIVNKIKSTSKKTQGAPEKQYKVTLRVGIKNPQQPTQK